MLYLHNFFFVPSGRMADIMNIGRDNATERTVTGSDIGPEWLSQTACSRAGP